MSSNTPARVTRCAGPRALGRLTIIAAAAAALSGTLLAMGGRWMWLLELFTHFCRHYAVALVIGAVFCAATKRWWLAAIFGLFATLNLAQIVPLYIPTHAQAAGGRTVRLLLANVHVHNRDRQRFLQLVRDVSPDVIIVLEVSDAWRRALDTLAAEYPQRVIQPREDSFGIALLSRLPAEDIEVREIGPAEVPSVLALIDCGDNAGFQLVGTHPLPPISAEYATLRNDQLRDVGQLVGTLPRPTVLAGDLNATSWSPFFRGLVADSGLRDSRIGFGVQPSWPSRSTTIGIPIDHVLVSSEMTVERRAVGPDIGSDHRPVIIDLRVPTVATREAGEGGD
jgi:endonuclease/exonuclease/phosphatase (EEP) superfamily protein YafD